MTPNSDFVRTQRLAFFANPESPAINVQESNAKFFLHSNSFDSGNNAQPRETSENGPTGCVSRPAQSSSPPENTMVSTEADCASASDGEAQYQEARFDASIDGIESASSSSQAPLTVPATLYPGVKREGRPRDEDPNIMPIPQELGFEFDTRQLQDLSAIAHGGNGCARDGAGFSVEQDYEWGGGGMMGYKASTTAPEVPESDAQSPYEGGKGDDEGLLIELPGAMD